MQYDILTFDIMALDGWLEYVMFSFLKQPRDCFIDDCQVNRCLKSPRNQRLFVPCVYRSRVRATETKSGGTARHATPRARASVSCVAATGTTVPVRRE